MTESAGTGQQDGGDMTRRVRARAAALAPDILGPSKLLRVVWPFAVLTACLLLLAAFSMELLTAARSYVGGEGLWSKGQKQAVYSLNRFAESRAEGDFSNYLAAIAIPLGDRKARLELEKPDPDLAVIRAGFLEGRNQPDDVSGMIRLYRMFRNVYFMAHAIDTWTRADAYIVELTGIAEQLHQEITRAAPDKARITALLFDIDRINRQLTPLEDDFSQTLGEASRLTRGILFVVIAFASALLLAIAVLLTRRFLRQAAALEQALRISEERYALAVEGSHDGLWDWDIAANAAYYSPRFLQMLGYAPGEIKPGLMGYEELVHPDDVGRARHALEQHQQRSTPYAVEYRLRTKSGDYRWFHARGQTVRGPDGVPARMAGSITDITERRQRDDHIRRMAFHDPLTRLPNRASFDQNVSRALALAEASGKRLALLFVDLDEFKKINDAHGHKGGDCMLQAIAIRLADSLRKTDFAARVGGDEFIVLSPEIADLEAVAGLASKLLDRISKPLVIEDRECSVTASIGISFFPEDGADLPTLLKAADSAMYRAKGVGKNTFRFHSTVPRFEAADQGLPGFSPAGRREAPA